MKILILLAYFNRPKMVRFALESIKMQSYKNWELVFVDDGSDIPGRPIVEEILRDDLDKIKFYNTNHSVKDKINQGGSIFGYYWTQAMYESNADISIMLCDDDGIFPDALENLSNYYLSNPNIKYSYGDVSAYDPSEYKHPLSVKNSIYEWPANYKHPINPSAFVDASQVSWRIKDIKDHNIQFAYPKTACLDADIYEKMFKSLGYCLYNEIIVQYKGVYSDQLSTRDKVDPYSAKDI